MPNRNIDLTRKNIMKRDGMQCQYCGKKHIQLTVDHILPKSRGGKDEWENLVTACYECNNKKGNRTPEEAGMKLLSIPKRPNPLSFIKNNLTARENSWKDYLFF
ncbi:MAG: HNH endonuclease [Candidatus Kapaibacteriota bacterium]